MEEDRSEGSMWALYAAVWAVLVAGACLGAAWALAKLAVVS